MTTTKGTAKLTPLEAANAEFERRVKQFGGNAKLAQVFAREVYDRVAGRQ